MLFALAISEQVSFCPTVYTGHVFSKHRVPLVGKLAQKACRSLSMSSQPVPMPCDVEMVWQSSPDGMVYSFPLQAVEVGDAVVVGL